MYNNFTKTLKDKIEKNEYKLYYETDGNMIFVFNELEGWDTYEFMYDLTNNTILIK